MAEDIFDILGDFTCQVSFFIHLITRQGGTTILEGPPTGFDLISRRVAKCDGSSESRDIDVALIYSGLGRKSHQCQIRRTEYTARTGILVMRQMNGKYSDSF